MNSPEWNPHSAQDRNRGDVHGKCFPSPPRNMKPKYSRVWFRDTILSFNISFWRDVAWLRRFR